MFNETTWKEGEKIAQNYMKKNGYKILYTDFCCVGVELDIVAILPKVTQKRKVKAEYREKLLQEKNRKNRSILRKNHANMLKNIKNLLIITEVKSRAKSSYGAGYLAVDSKKQAHMIKGAKFLLTKPQFKNMPLRFDVASVDAKSLTYFEGAFEAKNLY